MAIPRFTEGDLSTLLQIHLVYALGIAVYRPRKVYVFIGTMRRKGLRSGIGTYYFPLSFSVLIIILRPCREPVGEEGGERVPPSELDEYCRHHDIRFPCCLCAMASGDPSMYTESSVFLVTSSQLSGEYIASCSTGTCKYWGKSYLCLDFVYLLTDNLQC